MVLKIVIMLAGICLLHCRSKPDIQVVEARYEKFVGGRKETAGGINYYLRIVMNRSSKKLALRALRVEGEAVPVRPFGGLNTLHRFEKNDTLEIVATRMLPAPGQLYEPPAGIQEYPKTGVPRRGVWIEYERKKKTRFTEVKKLIDSGEKIYE